METTHLFATGFALSNMLYHKVMFALSDNVKDADAGKRELLVVHTGDTVEAEGNLWNLIDGCRMIAEAKENITDEQGDQYIGYNEDGSIVSMSLQQNADEPNRFNINILINPIKMIMIIRICVENKRWNLEMDVYNSETWKAITQSEITTDTKLFTDIVFNACNDFLRTTTDRPMTSESLEGNDDES